MKKLRSILVLFLLFSVMFMANEKVDASAGRLQSASITTCNGVLYGKHTNHWHYAVKRGKYYYPSGSPVSKPCGKAKKKKSSGSSYSYNSGYSSSNSAKKAVANNKVTSDKEATKDETDKEKDDVDTLKDQEETTPEISNFDSTAENINKKIDEDSKESGGGGVASGFVAGLIGGIGGSYLVRRKRSKKKKDDLTNW